MQGEMFTQAAEFREKFEYTPQRHQCPTHYNFMKSVQNILNGLKEELSELQMEFVDFHENPETGEMEDYIIYDEDLDVHNILKELCDIQYILNQMVYFMGFEWVFAEALARVHESNMSKLWDGKVVKDKNGKVQKPPSYRPADLSDLV